MHRSRLGAPALVLMVVATLAACGAAIDSAPRTLAYANGVSHGLSPLPCTAHSVRVPGDYIVLVSVGTFHNGSYRSSGTFSSWNDVAYTIGSVRPTPSPRPPVPEYAYYGTYSLEKHRQSGCAYLFVTQSGQPFPGIGDNALSDGAPSIEAKHVRVKALSLRGPLTITLDNVSPGGGRGSMKLTRGGAAYDSGTIVLTGRVAVP